MRRGDFPVVYSNVLGDVAEELKRATIPVIDDLSKLNVAPEIIHGQHNLDTGGVLSPVSSRHSILSGATEGGDGSIFFKFLQKIDPSPFTSFTLPAILMNRLSRTAENYLLSTPPWRGYRAGRSYLLAQEPDQGRGRRAPCGAR